jgi:hypothetical protein
MTMSVLDDEYSFLIIFQLVEESVVAVAISAQ